MVANEDDRIIVEMPGWFLTDMHELELERVALNARRQMFDEREQAIDHEANVRMETFLKSQGVDIKDRKRGHWIAEVEHRQFRLLRAQDQVHPPAASANGDQPEPATSGDPPSPAAVRRAELGVVLPAEAGEGKRP